MIGKQNEKSWREGAQAKVKPIVKVDVHAPIFYFPKILRNAGVTDSVLSRLNN